MLTRKEFIIKSAYSAAVVSAFTGCVPGMSYLQNLFAEDNKTIANVSDRVQFLLHHASLAPSGHNSQPWKIKILSENEWIIGWDKNRSLPAVDPDNRELLLSIGGFCEALSIAAAGRGLSVTQKILTYSPFDPEFVKITFKPGGKSERFLNSLKKRRTLRKNILNNTVNADDKKYILSDISSGVLMFDKGSREAAIIENAVLESNRIQAFRDDAQSELASWIRWSGEEGSKYKNGITPASMEIDGIGGWYVSHFFDRDNVMSESFRNQGIDLVENQLSSYGSWLVITSKNQSPETLIKTGGDFLRIGLKGYDKKISLHPMSQPLEEKGFRESLQNSLGIKDKIQFIIRAGYVENYSEPVSLRMPVEKILYK